MRSVPLLFLVLFIAGCKKPGNNCERIKNIYITSNSPVRIGDSIKIYTQEVGGFRVYKWSGPDNFMSQYPRNTIYDAQLTNKGWYYLSLSNNECETKGDSVYIDVKLQQGTPACTVTDNTCAFNNRGTDSYPNTYRFIDPAYEVLNLQGSGTSTLEIYFHDYWKTREPEDGIYKTKDVPVFEADRNYNEVFISTIKQSVYFSTYPDQTVYVSHVNGKLKVSFCDLKFGGYDGSASFKTTASGSLIEK